MSRPIGTAAPDAGDSMAAARRREAVAVLVCVAAAVALTWPTAAHFNERLGGDLGDPLQTLWSWRSLRDAVVSLNDPFFSTQVYFPRGASLVFQTFDLPIAVAVIPLWSFLSPAGVYNAGVLFAFFLSVYGMYRLVRELTGDTLVALCAGVLFAATPYHLAHARGHQHLVDMGWLPLSFVYLHRILEGRARHRDAVAGGFLLGLAGLASWYHIFFAAVLVVPLVVAVLIARRGPANPLACVRQAGLYAACFLLLAGPLAAAVWAERSREPIAGAHQAVDFSGDLEAFVHPNPVQRWSDLDHHADRWTGYYSENALYPGFVLLGLAIWAAWRGSWPARPYLFAAAAGATLALGPSLHVGGRLYRWFKLPYAWLEHLLPALSFAGVPVRFGFVLYFGIIVAAATVIAGLRTRIGGRLARAALALVPAALTLVEYAPRPFTTTELHTPAPLLDWAKDPRTFVVLDLSGASWQMWHATLHRKPLLGGFLTRVSKSLEDSYVQLPVVAELLAAANWSEVSVRRTDRTVDFDWGAGSPAPEAQADHFSVTWTGTLTVPRSGSWTFFLSSDDGSSLELDQRFVVGGPWLGDRSATVPLEEGPHAIVVRFTEDAGIAYVHLAWQGSGVPREIVPTAALRAPDGQPGLAAEIDDTLPKCGFDRKTAREWLRDRQVRYVITTSVDHPCVSKELALPRIYESDRVWIYEVPAED